jgi:hypothetical protein
MGYDAGALEPSPALISPFLEVPREIEQAAALPPMPPELTAAFDALPLHKRHLLWGRGRESWSLRSYTSACVAHLFAEGWQLDRAVALANYLPAGLGTIDVDSFRFDWAEREELKRATEERAQEAKEPVKARRILTPADCAVSEPRKYIVKGLLAARDVGCIYGAPGAGKSVIAPYIAYAVAQGREVFGRRVKPGRVLYVPAEDQHGMKSRVHALLMKHEDAPDFRLADGVTDLHAGKETDLEFLQRSADELKPALIVIDTLAAAFPGIKENDPDAMGAIVATARDLTRCGACVVLIHHAPKDGDTPRGHSVLNGALDVAIRVTRDGELVRGTLTKNRNGPCDVSLAFSIRSHRIGTDEDGDAITAPVLEEADPDDADKSGAVRLSRAEAMALGWLHDTVVSEGRPLPAGDGWPSASGILGVPVDRWRSECVSRGLSTGEAADSHRKAFARASAGLRDKRQIAMRDGIVWAVKTAE